MSSAQTQAELQKLGHQVGVDVDELAFLASVPADELRALRSQIGEALFQADKHYFTKVAALSKNIPAPIAAKVTEFALPPLIAARVAELLEPAKAVDLVGRISGGYLAKVAAAMDPTRAPHIIEKIPPDKVALVGRELAAKGEWVVIGGFVSTVSESGLRASVGVFTGEQLLRIGFVLDDTSRLASIAEMLSDAQVDQLLVAAGEHSLWPELDELVANLSADQAGRLAQRLASAPESAQTAASGAVASGAISAATAAVLGLRS
jgi:hypothetical protein